MDAWRGARLHVQETLGLLAGNYPLTVGKLTNDTVIGLRTVGEPVDMIVDGFFREFVGYLAVDDQYSEASGPDPIATVFFVHFQDENGGAVYGVTARHCLDGNEVFYVLARGAEPWSTSIDDWVQHPTTDLAVCKVNWPPAKSLPLRSDTIPLSHHVKFGSPVFTIGLFARLPGKRAVESIVRIGHVALPVTEDAEIELRPVTEKDTLTSVRGRLIETRSVGGQSGCPVFIHSEFQRLPYDPGGYPSPYGQRSGGGVIRNDIAASQTDWSLLGLLHGHYEIAAPTAEGGSVDLNAGIALVIPVDVIWEFLMTNERLVEDRKKAQRRPAVPPKPDAVIGPESFTKEDFEDALRKVSRRIQPSQSDEEK